MSKRDLPEIVRYYANELSGDHADDAWHSLVELGPAALPHVVHAFEAQPEGSVAVALIRVVSEYQIGEALPFLATLLGATDGEIWKTALDGVVCLGNESALECLREALEAVGTEKRSWITGAISQIEEKTG